ncbi:MAG: saccharopine dehydrogenase NADP-binding domain-containing protein [bacterium]
MHPNRIVVLGGYGQAGRSVVRAVLERTDASVVIAGRSLEKAQGLANRLRETGAGERVGACRADAASPSSLGDAFQAADLVIVTSTTARHTAGVVRACLDNRCDYFDILDAPDVVETVNRFGQEAEGAGRLLVTQGGLAPGMVATVVRFARGSCDRLRGARVGIALSLKTAERFEQVYDAFDFIVKSRPMVFEQGAWRKRSIRDTVTMNFGDRFGTRKAFSIDMPELYALPEQLGLEELSLWGASPNWMVDYVVKRLIVGLYKIRPRLGWPTLGRLIFWLSKRMAHEPSGCSIALEAWGEREGRLRRLRLVIEHEDNYHATGAAVAAFLRQYGSGSFQGIGGVRMMGHLIEPEPSLRVLRELGVTVREQPDA